MAIRTYRTVLEKSNPRIIREFQIEENRNYQDLVKTIALIHGWETDEKLVTAALDGGYNPYSKKRTIRQVFDSIGKSNGKNPTMKIIFPGAGSSSQRFFEPWTFRVEMVEEKNAEEGAAGAAKASGPSEEPLLLWSRGLNPYSHCDDIVDWNRMYYELLPGGHLMDSGTKEICTTEKQTPDFERINAKLKSRIQLRRDPIHLDKRMAKPLETILDYSTVNDLKNLASRYGLRVSTNQRKSELVSSLVNAFNRPEKWQYIINEMSPQEYKEFVNICTGNSYSTAIWIHPLQERYMIYRGQYWDYDKIPSELMDYYEDMVNRGLDLEVMKNKKFESALEACGLLYVVFSWDQAYAVASRMYPGEFSKSDMTNYWKKSTRYDFIQPDVMYYTLNAKEDDAKALYRTMESMELPYFMPAQKELLKIASSGLSFAEEAEAAIEKELDFMLLSEPYSDYKSDYLAGLIYEMYHMGYEKHQIEKRLREDYFDHQGKAAYKKLFSIIERYKNDISMVALRGYSSNSIKPFIRKKDEAAQKKQEQQSKSQQQQAQPGQSQQQQAQPGQSQQQQVQPGQSQQQHTVRAGEKIYPNSPCPCGSGKKFKYCHGRNGGRYTW